MSSIKKVVRIEQGLDGGRLAQSKILQSGQLLRGSRKRKDLVMFDILQVESANKESEEKVQAELDGLSKETENYEKRLKVLRQQLKLKESMNEKRYSIRIREMEEEFQRLKQLFDLFKLGIYLAKKDLARKAMAYIALKKNAHQKALLRIKQEYLRGRVLRGILDQLLTKHQKQTCLDFALKVYRARVRGQCFLALKSNAYLSKIQALKDEIARTKPRVIDISKDPIFGFNNAPINHTVKPIVVEKQKRVQKKQKIKVVKRPKKKAPKIMRKRQQIIFKAPPPVITQAQPQAVTVHLKVQELIKQADTTHKHHKCHKHSCNKHSPSPIRTEGKADAEKEDQHLQQSLAKFGGNKQPKTQKHEAAHGHGHGGHSHNHGSQSQISHNKSPTPVRYNEPMFQQGSYMGRGGYPPEYESDFGPSFNENQRAFRGGRYEMPPQGMMYHPGMQGPGMQGPPAMYPGYQRGGMPQGLMHGRSPVKPYGQSRYQQYGP